MKKLTISADTMGDYIRKIRVTKGYSQDFVANAIDLSQNCYCQLENGRTKIGIERIGKISEALGMDPETFFYGYFKHIES